MSFRKTQLLIQSKASAYQTMFGIPKVCNHVVVNCGLCVQLSCKELCAYVCIQNKVVFGILFDQLACSQRGFGKHNHNCVVVNRERFATSAKLCFAPPWYKS